MQKILNVIVIVDDGESLQKYFTELEKTMEIVPTGNIFTNIKNPTLK